MNDIQLLDCTLRDGGHINDSFWGKKVIQAIIKDLIKSHIDIIEIGFLQNCTYHEDRAMYNNVAEIRNNIISKKPGGVMFSLMAQADLYDIDKLEKCDGFIDVIRISFHDNHIREGMECCRAVVEKGYRCFVNPINLMGYSDKQILELIEQVNELKPAGFTIVDTFGSMLKKDLQRFYSIIDHNLDHSITVAVHLHENQALSYSLAQDFISMKTTERNICIDGSLFGMGRVPGNLCIELIMSYMNRTQKRHYDLDPVFDAIDEYIMPIKKKSSWGYASAYALSARHKVHRTYAEFLMNKGRLKTKQINALLSMISQDKKTRFDEEYIESLYAGYQNNVIDDSVTLDKLTRLFSNREVLLIGPGSSILNQTDKIKEILKRQPIVISANFVWSEITADFVFFSNLKRADEFLSWINSEKVIVSSNLLNLNISYDYIVNFADYAFIGDTLVDNCLIMLLKLMKKIHVASLYLAGFDGFNAENNFALPIMECDINKRDESAYIKDILCEMKNDNIPFCFVTESVYDSSDLRENQNE